MFPSQGITEEVAIRLQEELEMARAMLDSIFEGREVRVGGSSPADKRELGERYTPQPQVYRGQEKPATFISVRIATSSYSLRRLSRAYLEDHDRERNGPEGGQRRVGPFQSSTRSRFSPCSPSYCVLYCFSGRQRSRCMRNRPVELVMKYDPSSILSSRASC